MAGTGRFSARDRRALTQVLTAGLRHADIDQILTRHPVPGDPGHDAGKAGRIGLVVATLLASRDHAGLREALAAVDPARVTAAGHGPALQKLRAKTGLPPEPDLAPGRPAEAAEAVQPDVAEPDVAESTARPPASPAPAIETAPPAPAAAAETDPAPALADDEALDPGWGVLVEGIDPDHPVLAMIRAAGIPTLEHSADVDGPGWLALRPAGAASRRARRRGHQHPSGGL